MGEERGWGGGGGKGRWVGERERKGENYLADLRPKRLHVKKLHQNNEEQN